MTLRLATTYTIHILIPDPLCIELLIFGTLITSGLTIMVQRLNVQLRYYPTFYRRLPRERWDVILRAPTPVSVGLTSPTIILSKAVLPRASTRHADISEVCSEIMFVLYI